MIYDLTVILRGIRKVKSNREAHLLFAISQVWLGIISYFV